ncbi:MAG TPA: hypothetical protein VM452_05935 [Caulifigura sp.]|nr:hypothetical protein [Caulifigura sp.]
MAESGDINANRDTPPTPTAPPPRRGRQILKLAIAAFIAVFLYQVFKPEPPVIEALTPDGRFLVQFLAAGVGKVDYRPDTAAYVILHGLARDYLPRPLSKRLPRPRNALHTAPPTRSGIDPLLVLVKITPVDAGSRQTHEAFNETTVEFDEPTGFIRRTTFNTRISTGNEVLVFENFPRRDEHLNLRFVDRKTTSTWLTASFDVEPPKTPRMPRDPGPVPQQKQTANLDCTFTGFEIPSGIPVVQVRPRSAAWADNEFATTLEEMTGNTGGPMSPFESAWIVKTRVHRTIDAEFTAADQLTTPPLKLPGEKQVLDLQTTGQAGPASVTIQYLKGPGPGGVEQVGSQWIWSNRPTKSAVTRPVPGRPGVQTIYNINMPSSVNSFVLIDVEQLSADDQLFVIIRDQDGEDLARETNPGTRFGLTSCRAGVPFKPRENTETVTVSVIVSRPETVEFDVKPPAELQAEYAKLKPK